MNLKQKVFLYLFFHFFTQASFSQKQSDSISINESGLKFTFLKTNEGKLKLMSMLPSGYVLNGKLPNISDESNNEVFLHLSGENRAAHHGAKLTGGTPGNRLVFQKLEKTGDEKSTIYTIIQKDTASKIRVESVYEFFKNIPVVRRYTKLFNEGTLPADVEYLGSAVIHNFAEITQESPQNCLKLHYAFNSWQQEAQWKSAFPAELGWNDNGVFNLNPVSFTSLGSWSTINYLPMGLVENNKAGIIWFWQIEHNGSWHWEMSNTSNGSSYLYLGGPDAEHHQAMKKLLPGESYQTVPVAVGCLHGNFGDAVAALTQYRRTALVMHKTINDNCPVVFNDYMNCLGGNPLTENELPLIHAASKAGCNYFVIDAGWYAEKNESWWDAVGLWQPSKTRFAPNGLGSIIDTIRAYGMIPGLWLEPEVAGINSPLKSKPDSWFLKRNGKRIIDNSRYLLDFTNPEVREYMNSVVDRMVKEYKAGYIKMDYNNTAWGAEKEDVSDGQGLLEHNRAVVGWYKEIAERYPDLIVENCGSGGCRMDYAMLSQTQLQSSSDQQDYKKYPAIIVGAMAAVVPEQLAAWSYPRKGCDQKEASFNMVSAMLCRIHQSGNLSQLSAESFAMVKQGLDIYKNVISKEIPKSVPFFPLGMPSMQDTISPIALGIKNSDKIYISVWRLEGTSEVYVPCEINKSAKIMYPTSLNIKLVTEKNGFRLKFPETYMAAIIEISK